MSSPSPPTASNAPTAPGRISPAERANSVADSAAARGGAAAVSLRGRLLWFAFLAVTGCAVDLATKQWMFAWRGLPRANNEWWLIPGYVGIETSVNHGALFGLGQGYTGVFVTLSFLAAAGIVVWLFRFGLYRDWVITTALGLITGGIFGNLYDRLGLWTNQPGLAYGVRDWILFRYGEHTWPNFNLADSFLVCGALWLVWHSYWHPEETTPPDRTEKQLGKQPGK